MRNNDFKKLLLIWIISFFVGASFLPKICGNELNITNESIIINHNDNDLFDGWIQNTKLTASDGKLNASFGFRVSINGDYCIIGAEGDDENGKLSGAAYIFKRVGTNWIEQAKLTPSDGEANDQFGNSVSIEGDYAVVGAFGDEYTGSVYIFKHEGDVWIETTKIKPLTGKYFGRCVDIEGDYLVISDDGDEENGLNAGAVFIYERSGSDWIQTNKILPLDGKARDEFGKYLSKSGDYIIVSGPCDDEDGGSAYIFQRFDSDWIQVAKLNASDDGGYFGWSVSMDGDYAVVGSHANNQTKGAAYVFKRDNTEWTEVKKLSGSDAIRGYRFGFSVSIKGDIILVGADQFNYNTGIAYVYQLIDNDWVETAIIGATDGSIGDIFGGSVSNDGEYLIIGSNNDDEKGKRSGSAYVFKIGENQSPKRPTINGPSKGRTGKSYPFIFNSVDQDGDNVRYHIDWGYRKADTTQYQASGKNIIMSHIWDWDDSFIISAKALDSKGLFGPTEVFKITIPRYRQSFNMRFLDFIERIFILIPNLYLTVTLIPKDFFAMNENGIKQ